MKTIYVAQYEDGVMIGSAYTLEALNRLLDDWFGIGKDSTKLVDICDVNRYAEHPDVLEYIYTYDCEPCGNSGERYLEKVKIYCLEITE